MSKKYKLMSGLDAKSTSILDMKKELADIVQESERLKKKIEQITSEKPRDGMSNIDYRNLLKKEEDPKPLTDPPNKNLKINRELVLSASVRGSIYDAQEGRPGVISGMKITLTNTETKNSFSAMTNSSGEYFIEKCDRGQVNMTVEKDGYEKYTTQFCLYRNAKEVDVGTTKTLPAGELRIVLSWVSEPLDLDIYIQFQGVKDGCYHGKPDNVRNGGCIINLDKDERVGPGPETMTVKNFSQLSAQYIACSVRNCHNSTKPIAATKAKVILYTPRFQREFNVPTSGSQDWWQVFRLKKNFEVVTKNIITNVRDL